MVACTGAILTIAVLAMDPFTQQVIQHYSCTGEDKSDQATIPQANMYFETGYHLQAGASILTPGVQASLSAGIDSNGTTNR